MGVITGGIAAGAGLLKDVGGILGARAKNKALDERLKQEKVASNLKEIQRTNSLERILSTQVARQGASGFSVNSASFGAIQKDTLQEFQQDVNADKLNDMFKRTAIESQKHENIENAALGVGNNFFNMMNSFAEGTAFGKQAPVQSGFSGNMGAAPIDANIDQFRLPTFQTPTLEGMISRGRGRTGLDDPFSPDFPSAKGLLL